MKECQFSEDVNLSAKRRAVARNTRRKGIIVKSVQRFNLSSIIVLFILCLHTNSVSAQSQGIQISSGISRLDYLVGASYDKIWDHFQLRGMLEVGVGRTFAQGRFNPRMSVTTSYFLLDNGLVKLGPSLGYAYSFLQVNKSTHNYHHWHEGLVGYSLEVGRNWRFTHSGFISLLSERFKSQVTNKSIAFKNTGFYAQVGIKYCW